MSGVLPALVLVQGPEEVLALRAVRGVINQVRSVHPDAEVITSEPESFEPGRLLEAASPSLFGGYTVVVVKGCEQAADAMLDELHRLVVDPAENFTVVVCHGGGQRGKRILDALKKQRAEVLTAAALTTEAQRQSFVEAEFARAQRRVEAAAVRALVEAHGKDVAGLAAACAQLLADIDGPITERAVHTYYAGRVDVTGFAVADAAFAGSTADSLRLHRHAAASGSDPVQIVALCAVQARQLAKVAGAGGGTGASLAKQLGMAPWQVDKTRRVLRGWSEEGLQRAIRAVAVADAEVKGAARHPEFAVERMLMEIGAARRLS